MKLEFDDVVWMWADRDMLGDRFEELGFEDRNLERVEMFENLIVAPPGAFKRVI